MRTCRQCERCEADDQYTWCTHITGRPYELGSRVAIANECAAFRQRKTPLTHKIEIRVTPEDFEKIKQLAEDDHRTVSEWCVTTIFESMMEVVDEGEGRANV